MKPLFSIIIPTFNLEKYITECLQSIESQTISKEKFELILVDDCSKDSTCARIQDYLKNSTLKIQLHQLAVNQGPGVARNKGVDLAKGIFLLFIDGDDCLAKNCLKELEAVISKSTDNIDAIAYNWSYLESREPNTNSSPNTTPTGQRKDLDSALLPPIDRVKQYLRMGMDGSVIYTAVRKTIFKNNDILFYPGFHEDIDVIYKVYWNCRVIKGTEETLYLKRDRIGSIVRTLSEVHIKGYYRAWNEIGNYTKSNISQVQWDAYLNYFLSGLTGATAIIILRIFHSFPNDKDARGKLYEFAYESHLHFYHCLIQSRKLPKETYYDRITEKFLEIYKTDKNSLEKRELLDAFIECN